MTTTSQADHSPNDIGLLAKKYGRLVFSFLINLREDFNTTSSAREPLLLQISEKDLDKLLTALEVKFVTLAQCVVSRGYALSISGEHAPGIHYNLMGMGRLFIGDKPPIEVVPHTLIIVPSNAPFRIEVPDEHDSKALRLVTGKLPASLNNNVLRFVAGEGEPALTLFCGYFYASYGLSTDIFHDLTKPIVEQFGVEDKIDQVLDTALKELASQQIGSGAMSAALLKQVIVARLRRSLTSLQLWAERFSILGNPAISRAFSAMVANPSAGHTVSTLARVANLGRSAFMAQFTSLFGRPPISVLRDLRMRQAAQQIKAGTLSLKEIAAESGYKSLSSFLRAYRKIHGKDPGENIR
jgi:AraC-like DNA-binding protein